jgi:hypothetical protein
MLPDRRAGCRRGPGSSCSAVVALPSIDGWPMSAPRAHLVRLTAAQRHRLKKIARGHKSPHRDRLRAQIVLDAAAGHTNAAIARRLRVTPDTARKWRGRFASDAFDGPGRPQALRPPAPVHPGSPRCSRPRSRPWPASCPRPAGCRCRGGAPPRWPTRRSPPVWSMPSAAPPCVAGCALMRSNRGSTAPGSPHGHRTSLPAPPWCWTCTPGATTASHSATATSCCVRMRRPPSRPAAAATRPCPPDWRA